jgi:ComF family protein
MWTWLTNALFPVECAGCHREGSVACEECLAGVRFFEAKCELGDLQGVIALYSYADPVVKGILRQAKFHAVESAQDGIVHLVDKGLAKYGQRLPHGPDVVIVPIPAPKHRVQERGFDQVRWIAACVSAFLSVPIADAMTAKSHKRQSHVATEGERAENIKGTFTAVLSLAGKRVILVDDVVTSGSTMCEAARVLRAAGAVEVWGFSLARGGKKAKENTTPVLQDGG